MLGGDVGLPNGGFGARFPGLHIPVLDWSYDGATPTDTQFDTVEINRQYDGFADFPLYPLNVIATLNAVLGMFYVHAWPFDASLPADPTTSPAYQGTHGDTSYYFFENPDLPLFGPLRTLGVPEKYIDVVEPFFKVIVDLGYDRSIPPWEPTPARLIPPLDPATVAADLVDRGRRGHQQRRGAHRLASAANHPERGQPRRRRYLTGADRGQITATEAPRSHPRRSAGAPAHGRSRAGGHTRPDKRDHWCGEVGHRKRAHNREVRQR